MEFATAAVRSASLPRVRARSALVYGGARGACRVVGAGSGPAAARARRRALVVVAVASHHHERLEPLPSRAQEGGAVAVATTQDVEAKVHANDDAAAAAAETETSSPQLAPGKTVCVRFVLQKQCTFRQSVCLVGGDPALGLWDPLNAFALKQAEESHDWILEKDLPANKLIEFKFLLRDSTGKLHWQDGPNRSFRTGETVNTLVVFEGWDDVRSQKIAEEGVASAGIEQAVVSNDSKSRKDAVLEDELQADGNQVKEDESTVVAKEDKKPAVATDASGQVDWVKTNEANNPQKPMLHEEVEVVDELLGKENMENSSISSTDENYAEKIGGDNILSEDGVTVENGLATAYEHDFLWGWKALQQLMISLGFKMDTT